MDRKENTFVNRHQTVRFPSVRVQNVSAQEYGKIVVERNHA